MVHSLQLLHPSTLGFVSSSLRCAAQVLGFIVLLAGTSIYNEILKSYIPAPDRRRRTDLQVSIAGYLCPLRGVLLHLRVVQVS